MHLKIFKAKDESNTTETTNTILYYSEAVQNWGNS